jgi:quinol monooxygenase YgiN
MSVIRINEFRAAPGKAADLRAFLADVVAVITGAPGCEDVQLLIGHEDESQVAIVEQWTSVDAHQAAASRISKEQMAAFMPLVAEPPVGRYYDPA